MLPDRSAGVASWVALVLVLAALTALVVALADQDRQLTPSALGASVGRQVGAPATCVRGRAGWRCSVAGRGLYLVAVGDDRCWSAVRAGAGQAGDAGARASGCVRAADRG